jgi:hypothetical protein
LRDQVLTPGRQESNPGSIPSGKGVSKSSSMTTRPASIPSTRSGRPLFTETMRAIGCRPSQSRFSPGRHFDEKARQVCLGLVDIDHLHGFD